MNKSTVKKIIDDLGLTLSETARRCGLPLSTVSAHYNGKRKKMGVEAARKYVLGLGVSANEILGIDPHQ